jgi:hypothetical protein
MIETAEGVLGYDMELEAICWALEVIELTDKLIEAQRDIIQNEIKQMLNSVTFGRRSHARLLQST